MTSKATSRPSFSSGRRWVIGVNVCLSIAAMLALVVMANYLGARHFTREHWRQENQYQLSALTRQLLQSLSNQVKVVVFFDKDSALYSSVSAQLNEYKLASPQILVDYVDYLRNPGTAQLIKERYKLTLPGEEFYNNLVIFDCNGKVKTVYEKELYDLDIAEALKGESRQVRRSNFKGELVFTSAIVNVMDPKKLTAFFLEGHLEKDPADDDKVMGYSKFAALLQQNNIIVKKLLLGASGIPTDCNLLVIAGPRHSYEPDELEQINNYISQGGRMLVLLNNLGRTGLEKTLAAWGLKIGDNVIFDTQSTDKGSELNPSSPDIVVTNFTAVAHPIARPLLRSRLHLFLPRSVEKMPVGRVIADASRVDELVASSENGIAVTDIRNGTAYPNPMRDRRGAIPLVAAVEKGSVQGIGADRGSTRIVVVGDSIFLGNQMIDSLANRDFAVLAVNWLLDRSYLMGGIGPRPVREFQVVMTKTQMAAVRWLLLAGLPGVVFVVGLGVWWRRRA